MREGSPGYCFHGALIKERFIDFSIIISALIAVGTSICCFSTGIFIIVPHLFYIPIILAAYQHQERGVAFVGALVTIYLAEVVFFSRGFGVELINALIRVMVYLLVAIVISSLSSRLKARESRYRGIFETSGAGVFLFSSRTGEIVEMNPWCSEALGYSRDEVLSLGIPEIWPGYTKLARTLEEEGRIGCLDCNLIGRDGASHPVLISASPLPEEEMVCVVATGMREQKRMEEELRRSRETLQVILDTTDVGVLLTDPGREIVEANAAAIRFFGGRGREDLVGRNPYDLIAESDLEAVLSYRDRIQCREAFAPIECMFRRFDGTKRPVEVVIVPLEKDGAAPERMVVSFRDITERRRAEKAMQEERWRLTVINRVLAAATASRRLGEILPVSLEKVVALLDYDIGAACLVQPGSDTVHLQAFVGEEIPPLCLRRDEYPGRYVLVDGEARFVDRFNEKYPGHKSPRIRSFAVVPIPGDDEPVGCIAVASKTRETISESERQTLVAIGEKLGDVVVKGMLHEDLEMALASANRYLEAANAATESANLYLDILTHDINNANTVAMGYLQMSLESEGEVPREFLQEPLTAIYQSNDIIRNVTTIRRLQERGAELRPVQLEPVLRRMRNYYVNTSITLNGPDVTVLADDLIDEIFTNLIGNSVKFGGSDVEVIVSTREEVGGMVSVTVADTGPGISDDLKPRIFERKERGVTRKSGKGLGLYIVRMLVERYRGSVWAGDRIPGRPEEGAAITVTLRRYSPDGE
ncbi:MAG: PAS domain S-box protein [Methanoculleus sp.]|nr:PAS domain S-box protein [Methanomicrobiales archaeon]